MKQALHIFRKDVRRLWPLIAVVLVFFSPYPDHVTAETGLERAVLSWMWFYPPMFVIACWFLCALVVQQEGPTGDRQFWLTRPYERSSLLLSKVLFLLVFLYLPLVVRSCIVEARYGVPILPNAISLLWPMFVLSLWLILPGAAFASLTSSLPGYAGMLLSAILAAAGYLYLGFTWNWFGTALLAPDIVNLAGILPMLLLVIAAILLQYNWRKTGLSRTLLVVALLAPAVTYPVDGLVSLSTRLRNPGFDANRIQIAFDESAPARYEGTDTNNYGDHGRSPNRRCESLALKVGGLPEGASLESFQESEVEILTSAPAGRFVLPTNQPPLEEADGRFRKMICLDDSVYQKLRDQPLTLRLSMGLTVRSTVSEKRVPVIGDAGFGHWNPARLRGFAVDGAGRCSLGVGGEISGGEDEFAIAGGLYCYLAMPVIDSVNAGFEFAGHKIYSTNFISNGYVPLVSGAAPGSRQTFAFPIPQVAGTWPINKPDAQFLFRTERVNGFLYRDLVYHGLRLPDEKAGRRIGP